MIKCIACSGTGNMPQDQIKDHYATSRDPVCISYGCQVCQGYGEVEVEDEE